jgi:PAS domain S-box-containing protein
MATSLDAAAIILPQGEDAARLLAAIVESSQDAIISKSLDGTILSWNRAAETMYGYPAAEIIGRSVHVIVPPGHRQEIDDVLRRVAEGERVESYETVRRRKDGRLIRVSLTISPVTDATESIVAASVIAKDITDRHDARRELLDSEERYHMLFDRHPVPMWVFDSDTLRFLDVNEAAVARYGYSREEFLSMTIKDIRPEEDVDELVKVLSTENRVSTWRHRTKDGRVFHVEVISREIRLHGVSSRLIIANDVSERMRVERDLRTAFEKERAAASRLRALDEMKNTFLNAVSHELRTPLSSVVGGATTLERLGLDLSLEDQRELLRAVTENALKLQRMLADLLDLDRLTRGALRPRLTPTELGGLVRRVVEDSEFVHGRQVEVKATAMVLPVDPPKVERILENLLANAIKYSPEGMPLWVEIRRVPEGAIISVDDLGPGVPEDLRESIFEPFRQGPNAHSHSPGVGIGLSLVSKFAEMHGGRAWWQEREGGGSSFRVLLRDPTAPKPGE